MTSRIAVLPPSLANQIAAGEVVERPASVVKELVENALDAGARRVQVTLEDGGRRLVRVTDDGSGMAPDDARLAFERHATSKVGRAEDLVSIHSYGFRGEALPSILAVSRVTMTTRTREADAGTRIHGEGSADFDVVPCGAAPGTDVQIQDLFFNVPARLKFLRQAGTEVAHVTAWLESIALGRPDVHLVLHHNGRKLLDLPPDPDLARRVHAVLGAETRGRLFEVRFGLGWHVDGLLSEPALSKVGPGGLTTLVRGRPVRDRTVQHAVSHAYGTLLERGRYPVGVLCLDGPDGEIDVNVHPAKSEVRFARPQAVHDAVTRAIRLMLAATPWARRDIAAFDAPSEGPARTTPAFAAERGPETLTVRDVVAVYDAPVASPVRALAPAPPPESASPPLTVTAPAQAPLSTAGRFASLRYVGQVGACFLVCESADRLTLVDQHAAHERVLFERFVRGWREGGFPAQRLLVGVPVPLTVGEVAALVEAETWLCRLGFEMDASSERTMLVRAHPVVLDPRRIAEEVKALAASLVEGGRGLSTIDRLERTAATLACHAAVRAGDAMTPEAVRDLLAQMDGVDLAAHCPHGRPVVWSTPFGEVARWFDRS